MPDEAAILVANALESSRLNYCNSLFINLSSLNMHTLQCIDNSSKHTLLGLSQSVIDSHGHLMFSNNSIGCTVEFCCIFKMASLAYKFLHSDHPSYFSPLLYLLWKVWHKIQPFRKKVHGGSSVLTICT